MSPLRRAFWWVSERLFDLACSLEEQAINTAPEAITAPVTKPRKVPLSTWDGTGFRCSNCGKRPRVGVCSCGLPPVPALVWVAGGSC